VTKVVQPAGIQDVIPYLIVENAGKLIEFIAIVFDADVLQCSDGQDKKVSNAIMKIGESILEIVDASPKQPKSTGTLHVYVPDVDVVHKKAIEAGAVSLYEPTDCDFGERMAGIKDPFGGEWLISTPLA
jgi:PhnB protein